MVTPERSDRPAESGPKRRLSLDALRGLAVLLMIEQHLGVWLWRGPQSGEGLADYPLLVAINVLGGGAAPLFVTLAGVGVTLLARRHEHCDATLVRRGLMIMAFGLALDLATPSWFSPRSWFVLHLIGAMTVVAVGLRRLTTRSLWVVATLVVLVGAAGQAWLDTPVPLTNERMAGWLPEYRGGERVLLPGGVFRLAGFEGHFPIFPWAAFYVVGMISGRWLIEGKRGALTIMAVTTMLMGGVLAQLGREFDRAGLVDAVGPGSMAALGPWSLATVERIIAFNVPFYPASSAFVLALIGLVSLTLVIGDRWENKRTINERHPLVTMGRASLTLLIVHVVAFREGAHAFGFWRLLSAAQAAIVLFVVFVAASWVTRAWARRGYRYGAEWWLRTLT